MPQHPSPEPTPAPEDGAAHPHWRANRRVMGLLLTVWFVVPCLLGIVFVEPLNQLRLGGFPLGFWFAQQGAIYVFVVLIAVYAFWMDRIDRRHASPGSRDEHDKVGDDAS